MDMIPVTAPMHGVVVSIDVAPGQSVPEGAALLMLESMKMEHVVVAPAGTRQWITTAFREVPRQERRMPLDTW
jgi:acetyl/propionyl-CoA carboxylase alpha subunit